MIPLPKITKNTQLFPNNREEQGGLHFNALPSMKLIQTLEKTSHRQEANRQNIMPTLLFLTPKKIAMQYFGKLNYFFPTIEQVSICRLPHRDI